ncbi:MAG: WD40 repeat domain-containing protein, partial [Anaerolineales bacterium]
MESIRLTSYRPPSAETVRVTCKILLVILTFLLGACASQSSTPSIERVPTQQRSDRRAIVAIATLQLTPTPALIAADMAGNLEVVAHLGRGTARFAAQSRSGDRIAIASTSGVYLFNDGGDLLSEVLLEEGARHVIFSPDDSMIAAVSSDGRILLLNANEGDISHVINSPCGTLAAGFSPDGETVYRRALLMRSLCNQLVDGEFVRLDDVAPGLLAWNTGSGIEVTYQSENDTWRDWVSLAVSPAWDLVALGDHLMQDTRVILRELPDSAVRHTFYPCARTVAETEADLAGLAYTGSFSNDGSMLALVCARGGSIWNTITGQKISTLRGQVVPCGWVTLTLPEVYFFENDEILKTRCGDTENTWRVATGELVESVKAVPWGLSDISTNYFEEFNQEHPTDFALSPDGGQIAVCNSQYDVVIWDINRLDKIGFWATEFEYSCSLTWPEPSAVLLSGGGWNEPSVTILNPSGRLSQIGLPIECPQYGTCVIELGDRTRRILYRRADSIFSWDTASGE